MNIVSDGGRPDSSPVVHVGSWSGSSTWCGTHSGVTQDRRAEWASMPSLHVWQYRMVARMTHGTFEVSLTYKSLDGNIRLHLWF